MPRFQLNIFIDLLCVATFIIGHSAKAAEFVPPALASRPPTPVIRQVRVQGHIIWDLNSAASQQTEPTIRTGDLVTLEGENFGDGPSTDLSKIVIGDVRALERDLWMFQGHIDLANLIFAQSVFYETTRPTYDPGLHWPQTWASDIVSWRPNQIEFKMPLTANAGPIAVQIQKRTGSIASLARPGQALVVPDPIIERVSRTTYFDDPSTMTATVATYGAPSVSNSVAVKIENPDFASQSERGSEIFWDFDFNTGFTHYALSTKFPAILSGKAPDRIGGGLFDPREKLGAIWAERGQAPEVVFQSQSYPISPMPSPLRELPNSAEMRPTGWVGWVSAKSVGLSFNSENQYHVGFACASCHAEQVTYESAPGQTVTRVFGGIPNAEWSMKFATVGPTKGVIGPEIGPDHQLRQVDKSQILYAIRPGTADSTLTRSSLELGSFYRNDFFFSPTAIPIITRFTPLRHALSRSESIAGFEGSYIHSEEPDGAFGAHTSQAIQDLTAYVSTLDGNHATLQKLGLYRWLKAKGLTGLVDNVAEGEFMQSSPLKFADLQKQIGIGKAIFARQCQSCHQDNFGTHSDENMFPMNQVGSYFSPTAWQRQQGSIRTGMIHDLYWTQRRGLLHDGHVRSPDAHHEDSISLLIDPDRCNANSQLYRDMYTLSPGTFRIPKGTHAQEMATRQQRFFVDLPAGLGTAEDHQFLYWDYQAMRRQFGMAEFGARHPSPMPLTPHPWCVSDRTEIAPLAEYLLTL